MNAQIQLLIALALAEDIGTGDLTAESVVPESATASGVARLGASRCRCKSPRRFQFQSRRRHDECSQQGFLFDAEARRRRGVRYAEAPCTIPSFRRITSKWRQNPFLLDSFCADGPPRASRFLESSWVVKACLTTEFTDCNGNSTRRLPRAAFARSEGRSNATTPVLAGATSRCRWWHTDPQFTNKEPLSPRVDRGGIRRTEVVSVLFQSQSVNSVVRQT